MKLLRFSLTAALVITNSACADSNKGAERFTRTIDLQEIIAEKQKAYVGESYGEMAGDCFTDADLERFRRNKMADRVADELKSDKTFHAAVQKVRAMVPGDRDAYLKRCRAPIHRWWGEIGEVSAKGQMTAGVAAERELANKLADVAERLLQSGSAEVGRGRIDNCLCDRFRKV